MKRTTLLAVGMLPPPVTGQALMFRREVDALQQHYDLKVIDTQFQKKVGEAGLLSIRKVLLFFALFLGRMTPLVLTKRFDILYYCVAGPSTFGLIKDLIFLGLLRSRARKTVYHFHGAGGVTFLMRSNVFLRAWARLVLFEPDLVMRPASPSDDAILCKAKRDIVVDNGIEDPITMVANSAQKWPSAKLSFAFVGVVTEGKGVFDLVEIARLLRDRGHDFTLSIVGEGKPEEIARLKQLIEQFDLGKFVHITGLLIGEQKFRLLQQTTIFLFPTYYEAETQPTVIMEALALGVPAVAYDWRGINTIIDQGVNGYVVPPRDVNAFCRAIEKILTDGSIDRMRTAARRIFLERFTLERHVEKLMLAFQSLDNEQ
jgi:glycosyltransferase involved in cell wall biosynthesis